MSTKEEQWILHSLFLTNLIEASLQDIVGSELRYHVETDQRRSIGHQSRRCTTF
jgi:hypothetical protein